MLRRCRGCKHLMCPCCHSLSKPQASSVESLLRERARLQEQVLHASKLRVQIARLQGLSGELPVLREEHGRLAKAAELAEHKVGGIFVLLFWKLSHSACLKSAMCSCDVFLSAQNALSLLLCRLIDTLCRPAQQ